jgi:DsbC/DsbD-like thiol-disulfide interchange protein
MRTDKSTAHAGESFTVTVDAQIASGWHIYTIDRPTGLSVPTKIKLPLPAGLESAGDWKAPEPALDDSSAGEPAFVYHDAAAFQQTIRVKPGAPAGPLVIPAEFRYQVCDRFSCRAPATLKLQTSIQIVP